ncbi:hypothetical protein CF319_g8497 [Tilletia indica]|nr:hypothetical protein CF319_g8497 [Tilletia indica]
MSGILTDVDGFNVMMYPKDIIKHFGRGQVVSLASHYQKLQDLPAFDKMMTLGRGSFIWRVDQEYKTPLINSLSSSFSLPLLPAPHKQAFIRGTRSVTAKMLCDALDAVGCESVRISAYGFKCPRTRFPDFANMIHPEVHTNTWDFAVNYRSNKIPLVSSRNILDSSVCTEYPMLGPLGGGFGSLKYKIKHNDHDYTVKIYPRLVHAIKAVSGNLVQFAPDTVNTLSICPDTLFGWESRDTAFVQSCTAAFNIPNRHKNSHQYKMFYPQPNKLIFTSAPTENCNSVVSLKFK